MSLILPPEWSNFIGGLFNIVKDKPNIKITSGCGDNQNEFIYTDGGPDPVISFLRPTILANNHLSIPLLHQNDNRRYNVITDGNTTNELFGSQLQTLHNNVFKNEYSNNNRFRMILTEKITLPIVTIAIQSLNKIIVEYDKFQELVLGVNPIAFYLSALEVSDEFNIFNTIPRGNANNGFALSISETKQTLIKIYENISLDYIWEARIDPDNSDNVIWDLKNWQAIDQKCSNIISNTTTEIERAAKSAIKKSVDKAENISGSKNIQPNLDCKDPKYVHVSKTHEKSIVFNCGQRDRFFDIEADCGITPDAAHSNKTIEITEYQNTLKTIPNIRINTNPFSTMISQ